MIYKFTKRVNMQIIDTLIKNFSKFDLVSWTYVATMYEGTDTSYEILSFKLSNVLALEIFCVY